MKMKPLILGIAVGAVSAATYAFSLPLPQSSQFPAPSAGTMMPIPEIKPVQVDPLPAARNIIDQARQAADRLEYNQTGRIGANISDAGHTIADPGKRVLQVADSTQPSYSLPGVAQVTDPCVINPNLASCVAMKPENQCKAMGGTWSDGKCSMPSSGGGITWPANKTFFFYYDSYYLFHHDIASLNNSWFKTNSTGTAATISLNGKVYEEDLRNKSSLTIGVSWKWGNSVVFTPSLVYFTTSDSCGIEAAVYTWDLLKVFYDYYLGNHTTC